MPTRPVCSFGVRLKSVQKCVSHLENSQVQRIFVLALQEEEEEAEEEQEEEQEQTGVSLQLDEEREETAEGATEARATADASATETAAADPEPTDGGARHEDVMTTDAGDAATPWARPEVTTKVEASDETEIMFSISFER